VVAGAFDVGGEVDVKFVCPDEADAPFVKANPKPVTLSVSIAKRNGE
jgi:hypothetical protein